MHGGTAQQAQKQKQNLAHESCFQHLWLIEAQLLPGVRHHKDCAAYHHDIFLGTFRSSGLGRLNDGIPATPNFENLGMVDVTKRLEN